MILAMLGSAAPDSCTRAGLAAVGRHLAALGEDVELIDLATEYRLLQDPIEYDDPTPGGQTDVLRRRFAAASGVVLGTPVHHGSYSGLLKNALDHLLGDAFEGRPVGLLANGGGVRSAAVACDQLRTVVRGMSGWSVPTHVSTSTADFDGGRPSPAIERRIAEMTDQMLAFLRARQPVPAAARG